MIESKINKEKNWERNLKTNERYKFLSQGI